MFNIWEYINRIFGAVSPHTRERYKPFWGLKSPRQTYSSALANFQNFLHVIIVIYPLFSFW
jgi:hypothetical protein